MQHAWETRDTYAGFWWGDLRESDNLEDSLCVFLRGMQHAWEIRDTYAGFWWGDLRESDNLEDIGVNDRILLKLIFRNLDWEAWLGLL
jgi:hypothetical protein